MQQVKDRLLTSKSKKIKLKLHLSTTTTTTTATIFLFRLFRCKEKKKLRIQETIQNERIEIVSYVQFLNQCATCTAKVAKLSSWLLLIYK